MNGPFELAGTRDFWSALLLCSRPSIKHFSPHRSPFQFLCPRHPASWVGSRAGSPASYYVPPQSKELFRGPTELVQHSRL